jgi:hypothetical protein
MAEEKIICSQCNKDLAMKFIEIKELIFCSNQCLEEHIKKVGQKKFQREYSDYFATGEAAKGWVPKYANDYMQMCVRCPRKLSEVCQGETEISEVYHDTLGESEEHRWCCHARFCLSCALSDGTVPVDAALKVQRHAESKSKEQNLRGVTTIILSQSFADLANNFTYKKIPEKLPELKKVDMSHIGACLLCDSSFGKQCEAQVVREFQMLHKVEPLVEKQWCSHAVHALADMLIDRENGGQLLKKIIPFAEQVAQEKGYPGVTTRCLFITLGRML